MDEGSSSLQPTPSRGRARGRSRGGLGKYLRARGRRGGGRPAEFKQRLVLENEAALDDEEKAELEKEIEKKYSKRSIVSNAFRYDEPEPELNSDGMPCASV